MARSERSLASLEALVNGTGRVDLPGYGIETAPPGPPVVPCAVCGEDEIPLNEAGECARCQPTETETCEDYSARCREIRRTRP